MDLLDGSEKILAKNINGYLFDASNFCAELHRNPLCKVPRMILGNFLFDGGFLIIEPEDYDEFIAKDPRVKKFIRRYMMANEFLYNLPRWCLYLADAEPAEIKSIKPIYDRVQACRKFCLSRESK